MPSPFTGLSLRRVRRFDDVLDGIVNGATVTDGEFDPGLVRTARRLHATAASVAPVRQRRPAWRRLPLGASAGSWPRVAPRRWPAISEVATATFLTLIMIGSYFTFTAQRSDQLADEVAELELFRVEYGGQHL